MRVIGITSYSAPSEYQSYEQPKPEHKKQTNIIIKVHAASINPIDVKKANDALKRVLEISFPYQIAHDCAGTVPEIGSRVTRCKIGDATGSWSEYVICSEENLALKPPSLSFADAASLPLAALTALQALRKFDGELSGKPAFIRAGLSGTGSYACQLAKNVFKSGKVITTVSTSKIPKVKGLLGDSTVGQRREDPKAVLPNHSVDFLFDTVGLSTECLPLSRPGGCIISISTLPPAIPVYVRMALNLRDFVRKMWAQWQSVPYEYIWTDPNGDDLDMLSRWVEEGIVKPVVGNSVGFYDIEAVRQPCQVVYDDQSLGGKGV
ncbi:chaperonin 10-like protein [Aspergillus alliaceus]|uniref:Chaperonin 10-like protein n=1 Tax=Petromyces alliaceus TaxID=209559 RepID=A0A5N7CD90_PETAA|nr:chaperonin 10-like protein [Aspergillus alliaceus]